MNAITSLFQYINIYIYILYIYILYIYIYSVYIYIHIIYTYSAIAKQSILIYPRVFTHPTFDVVPILQFFSTARPGIIPGAMILTLKAVAGEDGPMGQKLKPPMGLDLKMLGEYSHK